MKRALSLLTLALTLTLTMTGCSRRASVLVTGSLAQPEARLATPDGDAWRRACITHVEVFQGRNLGRPDWSIETADGDCRWLDRVIYGQVPDGFVERDPAADLSAGVTYSVFIRGWTRDVASVPVYAGADYAFVEGRWQSMRASRQDGPRGS